MKEPLDRILIVEDDRTFSELLEEILRARFDTTTAATLDDARAALAKRPFGGVLLDVRLGGARSVDTEGVSLLSEIKEDRPLLPVVLMSAYGDVDIAVKAMKLGANDFVDKRFVEPVELCRRIREVISTCRNALKMQADASELRRLEPTSFVGGSGRVGPLRRMVEMAAGDGYASVLVLGETGSGKEVVARTIHEQGWRHEGLFVAVNMMGLPPTLLESELFGHEKGAFTGASQARVGYIERAERGVLFLDEIGDLSADLQIKLLRFLEDRLVFRVGSTQGRPVDVQVIAATHRPVKELVAKGLFREDLYYRLKTIEIVVPPLRERPDDVVLLADHFIHLLRKQGRTKLAGFSNEAIRALKKYTWPGNVRQLRQAVEWAVLSAMHESHWAVETEDLPSDITTSETPGASFDDGGAGTSAVDHAKADAELKCIERALQQTRGRKNEAMALLGYPNRQTMRRRIQHLRDRFPDLWIQYPTVADSYDKAGDAE